MRNMYESPLNSRYASKEMSCLFSQEYKFRTWRKLWIALAEAEKELGLNIADEQIAQMKEFRDDINYEIAEEREKLVRHDVMSYKLFSFLRDFIVDIVSKFFHLSYLLIGNVQAKLLFSFRQGNPKLSPGSELIFLGKKTAHFLACIT